MYAFGKKNLACVTFKFFFWHVFSFVLEMYFFEGYYVKLELLLLFTLWIPERVHNTYQFTLLGFWICYVS